MSLIAIQDGAIEIDASIVAQGLELEPSSVQAMMRAGEITSSSERGVNEDAGRYRLTFFHKSRRFRLVVDELGTIIQRSIIDFGDRPLPARMHTCRTKQSNPTKVLHAPNPQVDPNNPQPTPTNPHPGPARTPTPPETPPPDVPPGIPAPLPEPDPGQVPIGVPPTRPPEIPTTRHRASIAEPRSRRR
jgi:Family of unknown function (DUF6522)